MLSTHFRSLTLTLAVVATVGCDDAARMDDVPGRDTSDQTPSDAVDDGAGTPSGGDEPVVADTGMAAADTALDTGPGGPRVPADVLRFLDLPDVPFDYATSALPAYLRAPEAAARDNQSRANGITDAGAELGRVLFYDTVLSANGTVACASCHQQAEGFSDPRTLSLGVEGGETGRHSMTLVNARYYQNGRMFWDERARTLEEQVLLPIQDATEMGQTLEGLVSAVEAQDYYPWLFEQAFGDDVVTSDRIGRALAQFVRSIAVFDAPWDVGMAATGDRAAAFPNYTAAQNRGKGLFLGRAGCAVCHLDQGPPGADPENEGFFFVDAATNNGLDATSTDDRGVGGVGGDRARDGDFKSSSLRQIAETAPYMHDGRFATLRDVIDFYDSGVQDHPNLDARLQAPPPRPGGPPAPTGPRRLGLTEQDKQDLEAFLGTLSSPSLARDVRWSDPFLD